MQIPKRVFSLFMCWAVFSCVNLATADFNLLDETTWMEHPDGKLHHYEIVETADDSYIDWSEARNEAELRVYMGVNGHLATITSPAEQDIFESIMGDRHSPWLGGYQPPDNTEPEPNGGWEWITGEPWDWTNWHWAEPSNGGGPEDFLNVYQAPAGDPERGKWNDYYDNGNVRAFIVEYTLPEPTALTFLILGGLAVFRKNR